MLLYIALIIGLVIIIVVRETYIHHVYFTKLKLRISLKSLELDIYAKEKSTPSDQE